MSLAMVHSRALDGLHAPAVTVEVHLANGLPTLTLVGLVDTEVREARERVRAALINSGLDYPHNKRIVVNLAPADLPKDSGRFDLPIAIGILAASGQIDPQRLADCELAGELSLSGDLRPVRGALALALSLRREGQRRTLILPVDNAREAALVEGLPLGQARHLLDVVNALSSGAVQALETPVPWPQQAVEAGLDWRDVRGQTAAKRALEVAAAGGHNVLMVGPPGTGKSMLAMRFAGLLPPLQDDEALESAAVLSLAGHFKPTQWGQRAIRTPHHTASAVALVGGGVPPRPGEISLAHRGILFLDELPEFRGALDALREPLETGRITVSRAGRQAEFPAQFQLVAAMNPCPCGHAGNPQRECRCTAQAVARYQSRLSGPLLERIDVHIEVPAVPAQTLAAATEGETSAAVAQRVAEARQRQYDRQGMCNAHLVGQALDDHVHVLASAQAFLQDTVQRLAWSARGYHRVLRLARTIADLAGSETTQVSHIAEAVQYRRALMTQG